jgi:acyl-CoA thioesterase-1
MKRQLLLCLFIGGCTCLAGLSASAQNIMPMGDSVTSRGSTPESSYRYWLWQDLQNAGYNSVSFVGSQSGVSDGTPANTDFEQNYEGGDGWSTGTGITDLPNATSQGADIVLLDLGSNDLNEDFSTKTNLLNVQANLQTIIEGFANANPNIVILLAVPTHWENPGNNPPLDTETKQFESGLGSAVSKAAKFEKKNNGINVVVVNLSSGFSPKSDTVDGTHPNIKGEQLIAKRYFSALRSVLKKLGVVPQRIHH